MHRLVRFVFVAAFVAAGVGISSPARAGQGASQWCSDDTTGGEVHIIDDPVTVNAELSTVPPYFMVCYSTTPYGESAPAVTGGHVFVDVDDADGYCRSDDSPTVLAVDCSVEDAVGTGRQGKQLHVTVRFQGTTVGAHAAGLRNTVCVDDVVIVTPVTSVGTDVGACT